eukprot:GHRQ01036250.1.p1 GENE.GHRQ01036250.1~~GHRQ01036250.1.p1  ORF type:complete len:192 (+),score=29.26 GHRQ01036250.1:136-711(+)
MPIIPEKRQLEDHVHGALAAQFWSQSIENTRSLNGLACTAPCEPQPLRLHAPSGLSRTQFLVAAHAVRVPVFPGFCDEHGGTVLDRVLLQSGGQKWWGALIGRAKLQRGIQQRSATTLVSAGQLRGCGVVPAVGLYQLWGSCGAVPRQAAAARLTRTALLSCSSSVLRVWCYFTYLLSVLPHSAASLYTGP